MKYHATQFTDDGVWHARTMSIDADGWRNGTPQSRADSIGDRYGRPVRGVEYDSPAEDPRLGIPDDRLFHDPPPPTPAPNPDADRLKALANQETLTAAEGRELAQLTAQVLLKLN